MALAELSIDVVTGIARVTINRPEVLNAIDVPTARAIHDAVVPLAKRDDVRCVVLSGAGRAFVAGGDLARFAEDFDAAAGVVGQLLDALDPVVETLNTLSAPVVASVHGAVAGAGLSLMAACDLVVAAEGTRFLVAYDRIGAAPDCGGTWFLPRRIGYRQAMAFMLTGQAWSCEQALTFGLVDKVVAGHALADETASIAKRIAAGPTKAYGNFKRLMRVAGSNDLGAQLSAERAAFCEATRTEDFREGVGAFLEKRAPNFQGR